MRFYVLDTFADEGTYLADILKPVNQEDCPFCPGCGSPLSLLIDLPPHRIILEQLHDTEFDDIIFGPPRDMFVSERFLQAFQKRGLKGFTRVFPPADVVKIIPKKRRHLVPPTYHLVNIALSQTKLDEVASGAFREKPLKCPVCLDDIERVDRLVIDEKTWAGEDVFFALGFYGRRIVTERFAEMYRKEKLRGAVLIPAEKYREIECDQEWDKDLGEWIRPEDWPSDIPWPAKWDEEQNKWVPM